MQLHFIHHSCFAAEEDDCLMVFDYWQDPGGRLAALLEATAGKTVYFIVSHFHQDHFNADIPGWCASHPDWHLLPSYDTVRRRRIDKSLPLAVLRFGESVETPHFHLDAYRSTDVGVSTVLTLRDGRKSTTLTSPETPMGYLRERVDVKSPRTLTVNKKEEGLSWGAVYAQYQMPASQVEAQREGLNIQREVQEVQGSKFKVQRVGDRIHVRYVITADRDYEYVRLLCPRPAAAEPDSQLSGYRWQGGLGYYRAIHDASSEYFIDHMPRGTYVIEEDWLITRSGNYTLSPAMLQCLYAPEFQAHTAGSMLRIEP